MAFTIVSKCCQTRYTEESSESNNVDHINVCVTCGLPCKLTRIGESDGTPRSAAQAYNDSFNEDGSPKFDPDGIGILGGTKKPSDTSSEAVQAPEKPVEAITVKEGLIYHNGKVIGTALSDRERYQSEYGEEWKGSDEALKKVLQ
jgi:hypothetical protein